MWRRISRAEAPIAIGRKPLILPTWRPTQETASRWLRAISSAREPSSCSPNMTKAASTSAMRPIASSRSTSVSNGIAPTSRAIRLSRPASRASIARLRSDGATAGWSNAHVLSAWVNRFSPIARRMGTTVAGGHVHAALSVTSMVRATSGSVTTQVRIGPMRIAETGPSAAVRSSQPRRSASNRRRPPIGERWSLNSGSSSAMPMRSDLRPSSTVRIAITARDSGSPLVADPRVARGVNPGAAGVPGSNRPEERRRRVPTGRTPRRARRLRARFRYWAPTRGRRATARPTRRRAPFPRHRGR